MAEPTSVSLHTRLETRGIVGPLTYQAPFAGERRLQARAHTGILWIGAMIGHSTLRTAVREVVRADQPRVARDLALDAVVEWVVLPGGLRYFAVIEGDRLEGLLTMQRIQEVPRGRWHLTRAAQIAADPATLATVPPDEDPLSIVERMTAEKVDRFPITEDVQLLGMITRDARLGVAGIRSELQMWNGTSPGSPTSFEALR